MRWLAKLAHASAARMLRLQWSHKELASHCRMLRQQVGCNGMDQLRGALAVWPSRSGHASAVGLLEQVRALLTVGTREAAPLHSSCLLEQAVPADICHGPLSGAAMSYSSNNWDISLPCWLSLTTLQWSSWRWLQ